MGLGLLTPCNIYHSDPLSLETFSGSVHGYCLINENDVYKKQTKCSVGPGKKWLFKNNICLRYENFNICCSYFMHVQYHV